MSILNVRFSAVATDADGKKLSVAPHEALAQRGPVVAVTLRPLGEKLQAMAERGETDSPKAMDGFALIDTGASYTCIDQAAADRINLAVVDQATIASASHAAHRVPVFAGEIEIAGLGKIRVLRAMGATLECQGLIALIGRDALADTIFVYNGSDGSFSVSS